MSHYRLFVPKQAVGASLVYFDLFNAAYSGVRLHLLSLVPVVANAATVAGTVTVELFLTRTTAVGTGGTAATRNGTALDAATFSGLDNSQELLPTVTARLTPSGGATAGAVLSSWSNMTEETHGGAYFPIDMVRAGVPILIEAASGIRVVQSSTASVGTIGFDALIKVLPK